MTKPKNEAERLLNTIVSSRARLAAMRGDSVGSVEPSLESEQTLVDAPPPSADPVVPHIDGADFDDLPLDDDQTDTHKPAMVLGIEQDSPANQEDEPWPLDFDLPASPSPAPPSPSIEPESSTAIQGLDDLTEDEAIKAEPEADDPFSFIDLLPPTLSEDAPPEDESSKPLSTPPPVRDRPLMPLPTTLATCAPQRADTDTPTPTPTPTPYSPAPSMASQPEPSQPEPSQPEPPAVSASDPLPVVVEEITSAEGLTEPKAVAPRIMDPDRSRLEVDVIVDPWVSDDGLVYDADVPKLTTPTHPDLSTRKVSSPEPEADTLFDAISAGFEAIRNGNIQSAMMHFSDALDWDPAQIEARLARGRCRRDLGDPAGAMSDFLLSQNYASHSPEPHVEMGDLFFARKDYNRAIAHYDDALELHPEHAMALCRRGISHHHTRRHGRAVEDLREAARVDPNIPNIARYIRMASHQR